MAARQNCALGILVACLALTWSCTFSPKVGIGESADGTGQQDGVFADLIGHDGAGLDGADGTQLKDAPDSNLTDSALDQSDGVPPDFQTTEVLADGWHGDTVPDTVPDADPDTQTPLDSLDSIDSGDTGQDPDTWTPDPWQPCGLDGFCWQQPAVSSGAVGNWPGAGTVRYQMTLGWHRGMADWK